MTPPGIIAKLERSLKQIEQAKQNLTSVYSWALKHDQGGLEIGTHAILYDARKAHESLASLIALLHQQSKSE